MDAINVYGVFETRESDPAHKKLVVLFRTENAARGYAQTMNEYEAGLTDPSSPFQYTVELWVVSGC